MMLTAREASATFTFSDAGGVTLPDVLRVWTRAPRLKTPGGTVQAPVWRVQLPADPQETTIALDELHASLTLTDAALDDAHARLAYLIAVARVPPRSRGRHIDELLKRPAEAELLNMLHRLQIRPKGTGPLGWLDDWKEAISQFNTFVAQIQQHLINQAWIETRIEERRVAMTQVTWLGDFTTIWTTSIDAAVREAHERALALALASRRELLRQFVVVVQGAAQLVKLVVLAANPWLALPAALVFLKRLLEEYMKEV